MFHLYCRLTLALVPTATVQWRCKKLDRVDKLNLHYDLITSTYIAKITTSFFEFNCE